MKKKVTALACAVLMLATVMLPMVASAAVYYGYVKTANYGPLNMRSDTSTHSPIIAKIPYGKQIEVLDYFEYNTWVSVIYNGTQGYVMARYLVYNDPGPIPSGGGSGSDSGTSSGSIVTMFKGFQLTSYYVAVRPSSPGGFVHMRWAPSKQAGIMSDFYDGKQLEVLSQNNTWAQVRDPETDRTGFMMRAFLREMAVGYAE